MEKDGRNREQDSSLTDLEREVDLVNDSEAKYLIEQFYKYASWDCRRDEILPGAYSLVMSLIASFIALLSLSRQHPSFLQDDSLPVYGILLLAVMAVVALGAVFSLLVGIRYERNMSRLKALENHRSKYGSLPDSLTLEKITRLKPKDLEKLLASEIGAAERRGLKSRF